MIIPGQLYYDVHCDETILVLDSGPVKDTYNCLIYNKAYHLDMVLLHEQQILEDSNLINNDVNIGFYNLMRLAVK